MMIDKIKDLLTADTFDQIMGLAISHDLSPLKIFCMRFAEQTSSGVWELYDARQLSSEVEFELQGIWYAPPGNTQQYHFY